MCVLFHNWTKWEPYTWHGYYFYQWGKLAGQKFPISEKRQRRKCLDCGKIEEEEIA